MNQYKIVITSENNKPKFLNLKCPEPNCVNLGMALFNVCGQEGFTALLKAHKINPASKGVKDRVTITVCFASEATSSMNNVKISCSDTAQVFNNKQFLTQFKALMAA